MAGFTFGEEILREQIFNNLSLGQRTQEIPPLQSVIRCVMSSMAPLLSLLEAYDLLLGVTTENGKIVRQDSLNWRNALNLP